MIYDNRVHPVTRARIPRGRKNGSLIAIVIDNGYRARDVCSTGVSTVVKARLIECTLQLGLDNGRWSGTLFTLPNAGLYAPKIPRISSVVQIRISLSLSLSLSLCTLNLPLFISGTAILDSRIARRSCYLRRIVNFSSASAFFATCVSWIESLGTNKYAYNVADGRDASLDDFSNSKIERFLDKRQMRRLLRSYLTSNVDYFYHVRRQWWNVSVRIEN